MKRVYRCLSFSLLHENMLVYTDTRVWVDLDLARPGLSCLYISPLMYDLWFNPSCHNHLLCTDSQRLEVLAVQYETDKKDKLGKWETWKVKLRSILALKRGHLDELKVEDPSNNNVEELLAKAKVLIYNHKLNITDNR